MQLYVHVPFCRAKCHYCAFYSVPMKADGDTTLVREYTDTLMREIALWNDRLGKIQVSSIFFGGGTPSILPPKILDVICSRIRQAFDVADDAEISMEANPESFLAFGYAYEVANIGINRVSLGVQSLDERFLEMLGRPHTKREAVAAYEMARSANINAISLDLIWGLPGQKRQHWMRELAEVITLRPDHLSCYGLTLEDGTQMAEACAKGQLSLPEEKIQASMYVDGADYLEEAGFLQYEVSNFARMGFQCRHNLGYWENADYIGLGPAAASTIGSHRWCNPPDMVKWQKNVAHGLLAPDRETLSPKTRLLETVMLRLRTVRGLRLKAYRELTGRSFIKDNQQLMHALHKEGLVRFRNGYVRLTRSGMLVSNSILTHLFETMDRQLPDDSKKISLPTDEQILSNHHPLLH